MKHLLLSEKYRPKTMDDIILLPRIRKIFENGLDKNVILYGHYGTGKTTLARILIGKYSKDKPFMEENTSLNTSIDVLRTKIENFCSKVYVNLDSVVDIKSDAIKYVFLDEFEKASPQYQDALKAFIEDYSSKNVRFIFTTNHIDKVSKGIQSRFSLINFDCINKDEEKQLKVAIYKKIFNEIAVKENFTIIKEDLASIINKKFPDFRQILISVNDYIYSGKTYNTNNINLIKQEEIFNNILNNTLSFNDVYHYIMNEFGPDKINELLDLLGLPFINYVLENHIELSEKLFEVSSILTTHTHLLNTNTDPLILGISVYHKIQNLFNI